MTSRREAEAVLARYREPLLAAAYELQGRIYNILQLKFLPRYYLAGDQDQKSYAVQNTLYVVGQYFGWSEILRREIQFLSFSDSKRTRSVAVCVSNWSANEGLVPAVPCDTRSLNSFMRLKGHQFSCATR